MTDYTKLLAKIVPKADGEDVVRWRTGVVDAVNSDGTVNVTISGLVVPNLVVLGHVHVIIGAVVHLVSYRGMLLVIGAFDVGRTLVAYKTADESVASSTSLQNDNHIFFTGLTPNAVYALNGFISYTGMAGADAGGLSVDWTIPTGASLAWSRGGYPGPPASATSSVDLVATNHSTVRTSGTFGTTTNVSLHPRGTLIMGANSGTLQMRWAQSVSNAVATTLRTGSWVKLQRIV